LKITKIIIVILLLIICIILFIMGYYILIDIETKIPEDAQEKLNIETKEYENRKVFKIKPKEENNVKSETVIIYFHGGAYMAEATKMHWDFIEKIIYNTGATIIMPDYPLAPRYNYKDVFNMVEPLYKEIIKEVDTKNLIVMGDSAGGGIALALLQKIGKEDIKMPSKTILISPWLDVRLMNPKIDKVQKRDTQLNKDILKLAGIAYAGIDGIDNYLVNPIDGDLSKIRNITILIGTDDILNPDTHILKSRAEKVNVNIEIIEYENAKHIWLIEKNSEIELINKGYEDIIDLIEKTV